MGGQVIRLLLDENLSPGLVGRLGEHDICAQAVAHVGLSGQSDHEIWIYAFDHDFSVVTINGLHQTP
jgi:predicted nuclease of predicted toxin-antitoxin system